MGRGGQFAIVAPTITANFTQSAATVTVGDEVSFTDTSATNGAAIVAWAWNFGDGKTSTAQNPKHAYTKAGGYTVSLQVTDTVGYTATYTRAQRGDREAALPLPAVDQQVVGR